jgi:hypothetical protein
MVNFFLKDHLLGNQIIGEAKVTKEQRDKGQ